MSRKAKSNQQKKGRSFAIIDMESGADTIQYLTSMFPCKYVQEKLVIFQKVTFGNSEANCNVQKPKSNQKNAMVSRPYR